MLNRQSRVTNIQHHLLEGIAIICAAFASIALFTWGLTELAIARFWEPWVTRFGVLGSGIPFLIVALTSGFAIGAIVGLLFRRRALHVATLAGLLAAVAELVAAANYPDSVSVSLVWTTISAAILAFGLILGGISTRSIRHA
jgi:hypothetical protein